MKGAVLVDAASPGQNAAIAGALPPAKPSDSATIQQLRALDVTHPLRNPENLDWFKSLDEVAQVDDLGGRPLVVITAGNTFDGPVPALSRVWMRLQNRLARLSKQSVHVVANGSSHEVQTDAPELVQAAVLAVVTSVRDGKRLAPCVPMFAHVETHRCA